MLLNILHFWTKNNHLLIEKIWNFTKLKGTRITYHMFKMQLWLNCQIIIIENGKLSDYDKWLKYNSLYANALKQKTLSQTINILSPFLLVVSKKPQLTLRKIC